MELDQNDLLNVDTVALACANNSERISSVARYLAVSSELGWYVACVQIAQALNQTSAEPRETLEHILKQL